MANMVLLAVMPTKKQTILAIIIPAIIAIIPAFFTYSQSMYEVRQKYKQSHVEAEAGYTALVTSVKELQDYTKEQHDQLIKLQAYLQAIETLMSRRSFSPPGTRTAQPDQTAELNKIRPASMTAPELTEPAANFDEAAKR